MGAYLMMFAAVAVALPLPIINLIAAIVYHIVNKNKSRFIHYHSLHSLIAQLPITLLNWGFLIWAIQIWWFNSMAISTELWIYASFVTLMNILYFTFSIIAAIHARRGEMYHFVIVGKMCERWVFRTSNNIDYNRGYQSSS
jgi:uncharacterized membrane protein